MGARVAKRILVIDDTSYLQSVLSLGLAGGAQVHWVRRVLEGVADALDAAMAGRPFELIVLDHELANE
ncbi:MAG: hypothetical protein KC609_19520 [Myxococcales bacterium]|nr:hypothetical protein [Myxococcales bacterium]